MATDRALLRRLRIAAAKVEGTTGTAESLAAADGAMNVLEREMTPTVNMNQREQQGSGSMLEMVPGTRQAQLTPTVELVGSGGSGLPLWATTFLRSAGMSLSGATYSPDLTDETTLTAGLYEDGRLRRIMGAKSDLEMQFTAGNPVQCNFTVTGKMAQPETAALISPSYNSTVPPRFAAATFTIGGVKYKVSQVTITLNNDVQPRESVNEDDDPNRSGNGTGTGFHSFQIVNRDITITTDPEASTSKNFYKDMLDATAFAVNIVVGSDSNNTITINAPNCQLSDVQPNNRNELITDQLTIKPLANSDSGSDEISIAFS